jgi:hypothetical protein
MERIIASPTILLVLVMGLASCSQDPAPISAEAEVAEPAPVEAAPILVDRSNYQEAEVSRNFNRWAANGANNKLMHMTDVTPTGPAPTVRMNRDSLYSAAILDTSTGTASVTLPEGDLYQSVLMVDTEGYARGFILVPGTHLVPTDRQFIWILVRTGLEKGLEEARRMQSMISVQGMGDGQYSSRVFDEGSLAALTRELIDEAINEDDGDLYYGNYPGQVDEVKRLRSTASGFGGMNGTNMYKFVEAMPSNVCYQSTFTDPMATEFFSFTLYDTDGYLMDGNTVINSRDMTANADGTYTVSLGCGDDAINNISAPAEVATIGYAWRVYGASEEVENRSWDPIDTMKIVSGDDIVRQ